MIGARYYISGYEAEEESNKKVSFKSARDSTGHGSHTASIAAGRYVENMNYKGLASGGARGVHQWLGLLYTKHVGIQVAMTWTC